MLDKTIGIIIQARTGSTRLPEKTMLQVCGKPLLELMLERLSYSKYHEQVIVATTTKPRDDVIVSLCMKRGVPVYRGSEEDVLQRYIDCASFYGCEIVVRLTSDCPLMDPYLLDEMIDEYLEKKYTVYSNVHPRTYPDGFDIEIMPLIYLMECAENTDDRKTREHVTREIFEMYPYDNKTLPLDFSSLRLTVDYLHDYLLIKQIFEGLYQENKLFTLSDIIKFLGERI